eukprot:TRINITY_DN9271_c0_g1_i1.p1 TRINITY_DN9271_c0_g1~~TRINITY_DN9271_c0_g1_i1.p1  ORF type:complete len:528 (+),score=197.58 TRINITY_DN9271_c0_g1_i1:114-1697(+)
MDPTTTRLEGFLLKRGKVARGWKKRWFQLGDRDLSRLYYSEEKNSEKLGYIDLKVSEVRASKADSFVIEVCNADRTFQLQAANEVQFQAWLEFLRRITREASSNTEPLQQEIKRLLRVIHELSEERRLALELTNRLNEELARVTGTLNEQLNAANKRIAALEGENVQLRRAQGLETPVEVSVPPPSLSESHASNDSTHITTRPARPVLPVSGTTSFRASMRKTLRRTLELKRDEMRMASKQRLLDIESEVGLLLEELNLLHDIDGDEEDLSSDSEDRASTVQRRETGQHTESNNNNSNDNSNNNNDSNDDNHVGVSDERKLKKSTSEINLKELKHRVQSSAHQTVAIVDNVHERAATVVQQAQAEASRDIKHTTADSTRTTLESSTSEQSGHERAHSLEHGSYDEHSDEGEYGTPPSSQHPAHSPGHTSLTEPFRPRIDSQAPGKEYVAARIKSARTQWLTRDSMINHSQPVVHKPKVPLKRIDTAPSGHSFVRGVPRANTKTAAISLHSPRGVNQPVVTPSMLEDK